MTYQEKMELLARCKPEKKDEILYRIWKGERKVNITADEDLFFQLNADRMSMEDFVNKRAHKYEDFATELKTTKEGLYDKKYGETKGKKMRYLGEIPSDIYFTHPWFSPKLPREERDRNIKRFLNMFPKFRAGEAQL